MAFTRADAAGAADGKGSCLKGCHKQGQGLQGGQEMFYTLPPSPKPRQPSSEGSQPSKVPAKPIAAPLCLGLDAGKHSRRPPFSVSAFLFLRPPWGFLGHASRTELTRPSIA